MLGGVACSCVRLSVKVTHGSVIGRRSPLARPTVQHTMSSRVARLAARVMLGGLGFASAWATQTTGDHVPFGSCGSQKTGYGSLRAEKRLQYTTPPASTMMGPPD
jgi:hypothetical protein